jgi:hypothetical protein
MMAITTGGKEAIVDPAQDHSSSNPLPAQEPQAQSQTNSPPAISPLIIDVETQEQGR